jgi:hypothetical protein
MVKLNSNYQKFFTNASAAGFGAGEIINYLENIFTNPEQRQQRKSLENNPNLRPDEAANLSQVQRSEAPLNVAKAIPGVIGKAGAIGAAASAAPDLLKKGLELLGGNKQLPKNETSAETNQKPVEESPSTPFDNFLSQHPELGAFIQKQLKSGFTPPDAALKAKAVPKFRPSISKIEGDIGQPLENILSQLFGGSQENQGQSMTQKVVQQAQGMQQSSNNREKMAKVVALMQARMGQQG